MSMTKIGAYIETNDGQEFGPVRITYRHRTQAERTCKAQGIDPASTEAEIIMAWLATRDAGQDSPVAGLSRADWDAAILDVTVQRLEAEDDGTEGDRLDPTLTGH